MTKGFCRVKQISHRLRYSTNRNAPELKIGDVALFDNDDKNLNNEGFFLFKFPVYYGVYYSTQDIRDFNYVNLSCLNKMVENIGFIKKDELDVIGRLVHNGRNY